MKKSKTKVTILILTLFSLSVSMLNSSTVSAQSEQVEAQFVAEKGGYLIDEKTGEKVQSITKNVKSGTALKEAFPEVKPDDDYKFDEWVNPNKGNDDETIHSVENTYRATFYPDLNDNDIDDTKESVKVNFNADAKEEPKDITTKVGKTIQLPEVTKDNAIFGGWFQDSDFKKTFTEDDRIINDTTLYAKWQEVDEITKEGETLMIRERNVSDQVEKRIADRYVEKAESTNKEIDKSKQDIKDAAEQVDTVKKQYQNVNVGNLFMVKFFSESEEFLFSIVVPYGRSIKLMNDLKEKKEEYAVRQTTTIVLNSSDFVTGSNTLKEYDVRNVESNSIDITEIYPVMEEQRQEVKGEQVENENENKFDKKIKMIIFGIVVALLFLLVGGFFLLKRPRKGNKHNPDEDLDIEPDSDANKAEDENEE
ncbi:InlB B-repeat-containing protein [Enterococcus sp. AZ196]|uniref:InlB B-repeat-containing protein n=1 Tax=Enterococcus sp. AZ196 TaxID=2774659 RepID=UPI003D2B0AD0